MNEGRNEKTLFQKEEGFEVFPWIYEQLQGKKHKLVFQKSDRLLIATTINL